MWREMIERLHTGPFIHDRPPLLHWDFGVDAFDMTSELHRPSGLGSGDSPGLPFLLSIQRRGQSLTEFIESLAGLDSLSDVPPDPCVKRLSNLIPNADLSRPQPRLDLPLGLSAKWHVDCWQFLDRVGQLLSDQVL